MFQGLSWQQSNISFLYWKPERASNLSSTSSTLLIIKQRRSQNNNLGRSKEGDKPWRILKLCFDTLHEIKDLFLKNYFHDLYVAVVTETGFQRSTKIYHLLGNINTKDFFITSFKIIFPDTIFISVRMSRFRKCRKSGH